MQSWSGCGPLRKSNKSTTRVHNHEITCIEMCQKQQSHNPEFTTVHPRAWAHVREPTGAHYTTPSACAVSTMLFPSHKFGGDSKTPGYFHVLRARHFAIGNLLED